MQSFINLAIFIFGASIGSFLNVLIDRLPKDKSINGRSHCDYCKKKIAWYDLIPVLSFFILKGKTRCCHKKLNFQYPAIEILTGITFVLISNFKFLISKQTSIFQQPISNFIYFGLISCLIVIFVSDLKYHLISDYILLSLFVFSALSHLQQISQFPNFLISGFILALPIWLIYFFSKERSMGLGDVYLSAIMGFLLGWKTGFMALYIAFVTGAIFGLILIVLKRKKLKSRIPFGPFLVIGTVVMLFWGEKILKIIQRIYGF